MHDMQELLVNLMANINGDEIDEGINNELEGALYVEKQVRKLLSKAKS